ncbi:MAG: CAP domain-containing protein [Defluviitaleaceae bacterium]|nr:CAP domain-containing protein [Defluviitaleaceae bacterium]
MNNYEREIFKLTNKERQKHGLTTLIWNKKLADVAHDHSQDLALSNTFSHTGTDGSTPELRVHRANTSIMFMGENISGGRKNPQTAILDWMNSSGHRQNILNVDAVYMGVGMVYIHASRYGYYVTQVFGK